MDVTPLILLRVSWRIPTLKCDQTKSRMLFFFLFFFLSFFFFFFEELPHLNRFLSIGRFNYGVPALVCLRKWSGRARISDLRSILSIVRQLELDKIAEPLDDTVTKAENVFRIFDCGSTAFSPSGILRVLYYQQ